MRKFEREARAVEAALIRYVSRRQDKGGRPFDGRKAMPGDARAGGAVFFGPGPTPKVSRANID